MRIFARFVVGMYALVMCGSAIAGSSTLTWTAPTQNEDGSPLTDLTSYNLRWNCNAPGPPYDGLDTFLAPATTRTITGLPDVGTCYFVAEAVNSFGAASVYSNEALRVMGVLALSDPIESLNVTWQESQSVTFATFEDTTATGGGTASPGTVDLPATVNADDLLILVFGTRLTPISTTAPTGWTEFVTSGGSVTHQNSYWKKAVGTEDGGTVDVGFGSGINSWSAVVYRFSNTADPDTTPPEGLSAFLDTDNINPDSPSVTPTGGAKDYTWLSVFVNRGASSVTSFPTNYSNTGEVAAGSNVTGYASRELNATSEDPGSFVASFDDWSATTIAIHPATAGGASLSIPVAMHQYARLRNN